MALSRREALLSCSAAFLLGGGCQRNVRKIDLWDNSTGPHLRGAVFTQRRVYPDLDGDAFLGPGPVGAPISDDALASLAALGANFALLSLPGIWTETAPFRPDQQIIDHHHALIERCQSHGLFVVIGFRTGPGRSEFTFHRDADWFPQSLINETIWQDFEAHLAWREMCVSAAQQFTSYRNVVGLLPMVEPNANLAGRGANGRELDIWEPQALRGRVAGTPADWAALARDIALDCSIAAPELPLLISPDGYANSQFETLLDLSVHPSIVLALHDYSPRHYTHGPRNSSAGFRAEDARIVAPEFSRWALLEFGVHRWAFDADRYVAQRLMSLEEQGANSAYFRWTSGWAPYEEQENTWNPLFGPGEGRASRNSPIVRSLSEFWQRNLRHA